jgi:hypothetical protein
MEILKRSAKTDPLARAILEESAGNATYLSNRIQNELLNIRVEWGNCRQKITHATCVHHKPMNV